MPRPRIAAPILALAVITSAALLLSASAGAATRPAVARKFEIAPKTFTPVADPAVTVRVNKRGAKTLRATLVFKPKRRGAGRRTSVNLGQIPANRTGVVPLRAAKLQPGRYSVRIAVAASAHVRLKRTARSPGETTVVVRKAPPAPIATAAAPVAPGVFPVAGPHSLGGPDARFGSGRPGHSHQGQDITAAAGVPVVAPIAGAIDTIGHQAGGAGYYVVLAAGDGRAFFMAHLLAGSTLVTPGQVVAQGQPLAQVGASGNASGPHLHFEYWINGWRKTAASQPIDPLPQLLAWGG